MKLHTAKKSSAFSLCEPALRNSSPHVQARLHEMQKLHVVHYFGNYVDVIEVLHVARGKSGKFLEHRDHKLREACTRL